MVLVELATVTLATVVLLFASARKGVWVPVGRLIWWTWLLYFLHSVGVISGAMWVLSATGRFLGSIL